jgi:hypothetical protein
MSKRFAQGIYEVQNPEKYIGKGKPRYRSGWELVFMRFADNNNKVLKWASESIQIPYRNPLTGKQTIYVPDFFLLYQDKTGQQRAELIEIKPSAQTNIQEAKSIRDKAAAVVNQAKWAAASAYAKRMGIKFRVITENEIFHQGGR